jgi:hypothetical protein
MAKSISKIIKINIYSLLVLRVYLPNFMYNLMITKPPIRGTIQKPVVRLYKFIRNNDVIIFSMENPYLTEYYEVISFDGDILVINQIENALLPLQIVGGKIHLHKMVE